MKLIHSKGFKQRVVTGLILAILIITPFLIKQEIIFRVLYALAGTMAIYEIWYTAKRRIMYCGTENFFAAVQIGVLCSILAVAFALTRQELILVLVGAVATDVSAYFVGSLLHNKIFKTRPFPKTSPNKSWEGILGGYFIAIVAINITITVLKMTGVYGVSSITSLAADPASFELCKWPDPFGQSYSIYEIVFILTCPIVAIYGDYLGSYCKRALNVKDSNDIVMESSPQPIQNLEQIMTGHGGFLDRMDSIILVICYMFCLKAIS